MLYRIPQTQSVPTLPLRTTGGSGERSLSTHAWIVCSLTMSPRVSSGPKSRALKPQNDSVMTLPAGGKVEIEIACNVEFTSYGVSPSNLSDSLAACPGNSGQMRLASFRARSSSLTDMCSSGAFHSGTPNEPVDDNLLSGCALAIADKDDIEKVGWDDLVVFSVNHRCVRDRITTFHM